MLFFLSSCLAQLVPGGSGSCTVTFGPADVETGDRVEASWTIDAEIPPEETEVDLVVRRCDSYQLEQCRDYAYRDWRKQDVGHENNSPIITTFSAALFKAGGSHQFNIPMDYPTSDYYMVSLDSRKYHETGTGQSAVPYVYCVSQQRVRVLNTALKLDIISPVSGETWKYLESRTISWAKLDSQQGGLEQVNVLLKRQLGLNNLTIGTSNGLQMDVVVAPHWGTGRHHILVEYAENKQIYDEIPIDIGAAEKYFNFTMPNELTRWVPGQNGVSIRWTSVNIEPTTSVIITVEGDAFSIPQRVGEVAANVGEITWNVPTTVSVTGNNNKVKIITKVGDVESESAPFLIQGSSTNLCQAQKHEQENLLHDLLVCERTDNTEGTPKQPILITQSAVVTTILAEWLWCLGDGTEGTEYIRFIIGYGGANGAGSVQTTMRVGNEAQRIFRPLWMEEHGADLQIVMKNKRYETTSTTRTICFDLDMYGYDYLEDGAGAPAVTLVEGTCLETVDLDCECEYETDAECTLAEETCTPTATSECPDGSIITCPSCPQPKDSQFTVGAEVCSAGNVVTVHSTACTAGDRLLYEVSSKSLSMSVESTLEQPGCNTYWLRVSSKYGAGYVLSDQIERCEGAFNPLDQATADSDELSPAELGGIIGGSVGGCCLLLLCLCCCCGGGYAALGLKKKNEPTEQDMMPMEAALGNDTMNPYGASPQGAPYGTADTFASMHSNTAGYPNPGYGNGNGAGMPGPYGGQQQQGWY